MAIKMHEIVELIDGGLLERVLSDVVDEGLAPEEKSKAKAGMHNFSTILKDSPSFEKVVATSAVDFIKRLDLVDTVSGKGGEEFFTKKLYPTCAANAGIILLMGIRLGMEMAASATGKESNGDKEATGVCKSN